jgi:hypothetical protein
MRRRWDPEQDTPATRRTWARNWVALGSLVALVVAAGCGREVAEDPCEGIDRNYTDVELYLDVPVPVQGNDGLSASICLNGDCLATQPGDLEVVHGSADARVYGCDERSCTLEGGLNEMLGKQPVAYFRVLPEPTGPWTLYISYFPSVPVASGDLYRIEARDRSGHEITSADVTVPQYTAWQTCGHTITSAHVDLRAPRPDAGAGDAGD